jgi:hypothetical protein
MANQVLRLWEVVLEGLSDMASNHSTQHQRSSWDGLMLLMDQVANMPDQPKATVKRLVQDVKVSVRKFPQQIRLMQLRSAITQDTQNSRLSVCHCPCPCFLAHSCHTSSGCLAAPSSCLTPMLLAHCCQQHLHEP